MKPFVYLFIFLLFMACKDEKIDFSGEVPLKAEEFITAFPKITGSYLMADSNIARKSDTTKIGYKALSQFIPDSAIALYIGKDKKTVIKPVGIIEKEKENYLLINFTRQKKTSCVVFVTDKKLNYLASKELLNNQKTGGYYRFVSINKEPTFMLNREKTSPENTLKFTRSGWVYNDAGIFMLVVTDSNEDPEKTAVINPIDTLPRLNKLSGEYVKNEKNYISVRDGKDANNYLFFIHFEKDKATCVGELKGEFKLKSSGNAQYLQNGDPCIIDFKFAGNYVTVKEQGSCGNHRGIKCFFDDTYRKKREPKTKKKRTAAP
ncbi:hypothetical protein [Sediminibacterium sp.]|uniref:hypothetical protein n=1 Tax=Sediminibacterium sp. TaxID=1917865 RepID=UPI0025FDF785|nr:hypothetical protein [Sediminibacterium sp.]MBW0178144.1 hypothetical protein [Sediminibacterium sp.]